MTDLARGGDLWNKIAEEEKLNEQTTRTITRQLVESVEFLHKHQILHIMTSKQKRIFPK